jgi:hypothetical protein
LADPGQFLGANIIQVLTRVGLRFLVVGSNAAIAQGAPMPAEDLEITPDRAPDNLGKLTEALRVLRAEPAVAPEAQPVGFGELRFEEADPGYEDWLPGMPFLTAHGPLRVVFTPLGTQGYDDLKRDAVTIRLGTGTEIQVAHLADVIRSKQAANRPKDIAQLPLLRQTLEEIRKLEGRT